MSRRCLCMLLCCAVALAFLFPAASTAGERFGLLRGFLPKASTDEHVNPLGYSVGPPGPHRYPEYNTGNYPWYGYGFGVPTYNWGYFGARYRPTRVSHKGYYGDYTQWGYRRGY